MKYMFTEPLPNKLKDKQKSRNKKIQGFMARGEALTDK